MRANDKFTALVNEARERFTTNRTVIVAFFTCNTWSSFKSNTQLDARHVAFDARNGSISLSPEGQELIRQRRHICMKRLPKDTRFSDLVFTIDVDAETASKLFYERVSILTDESRMKIDKALKDMHDAKVRLDAARQEEDGRFQKCMFLHKNCLIKESLFSENTTTIL
jgi:hypothetical protein